MGLFKLNIDLIINALNELSYVQKEDIFKDWEILTAAQSSQEYLN